eukprot:3109110-Rhodomonas_salina.1
MCIRDRGESGGSRWPSVSVPAALHCEIKGVQPRFQYTLYRECSRLDLIPKGPITLSYCKFVPDTGYSATTQLQTKAFLIQTGPRCAAKSKRISRNAGTICDEKALNPFDPGCRRKRRISTRSTTPSTATRPRSGP